MKELFSKLFGLVARALARAKALGLNDQLLKDTIAWVEEAGEKFADPAARREFVVGVLKSRGVPESVARLAVELAVQIWKKRTAK